MGDWTALSLSAAPLLELVAERDTLPFDPGSSAYAALRRARTTGRLTGYQAERLCDLLGVHPRELWGDDVYDAPAVGPGERRTTCLRGHDLTDPRVAYQRPDGWVECRRCEALSSRRHREKRRRLIAEHDLDLDPACPLYLIRQRIAEREERTRHAVAILVDSGMHPDDARQLVEAADA